MEKTLFRCPVCLEVLTQGDTQYICENNHGFDIARKGYVNLLLPRHVGSGTPGDSKSMLQSRRAFFEKGYYAPVSDGVNGLVLEGIGDKSNFGVLDAGCGIGYYLHRLDDFLASNQSAHHNVDLYGIDVTKDAIHYAARRDKAIRFAVASSYHLPFKDESIDCLICIFAPRDETEFQRVLKPGGIIIVAAPGERHLYSLREALYGIPPEIGQRGTMGGGFQVFDQKNVTYNIHLSSPEDILNLLTMTPYNLHAKENAWAEVKSWEQLETEIDINLTVYRKVNA